MKRIFSLRWLALGGLGLVVGCKDVVRPDATGSIALNVIVPSEPAAAAGLERGPAQPAGHLTSATATVSGPETRTITLTASSTNFTGTITDLKVGTYTVTVQGFVGTEVDYFGQASSVAVNANTTTPANVTFQSFVPTLSAFLTPNTWSFRPTVTIASVPSATSYIIEVDRSNTFPNPVKTTVTTTTGASFAVSDTGAHYVRVRAANAAVTNGGRVSATQQIRITTDLRTSGDSVPAAPDLGFFGTRTVTLDSLNIFPATDADWFSVSDCNGDSLVLTAEAVRLTPPSPLNSVLLVYNAAGRLVDGNDDGDSTDARVAMLISSDGAYKARVSGKASTVGHYRLKVQAKAGVNNPGSPPCRVVPLVVGSVAAGFLHTCAVRTGTSTNTDCWGNNLDGQLGNGTTTITSSPTRVSGTQVLQSVRAGRFHSCGRTSTNVAYCWGYNGDGELGDNSTTSRSTPVPVAGGQLFQYVEPGAFFTCGLTTGGSAYCWGDNFYGQLGNGNNSPSSLPVAVSAPIFVWLTVGDNHACGATSGGAVYCWGDNSSGQLGNGGSPTTSSTPVLVSGGLILQGVLAGDNHTCARTNPGNAAYCWGSNSDGQLGDGSFTDRTTPVPVQGAFAFTALAGGGYHTCGLVSGTAYCWGDNFDGQLGDGTTALRTFPTLVSGGLSFQGISAGTYHTCGIRSTGDAYCWGWNGFGQNGNAAAFDWTAPVPISLGFTLKSISTNNQHSCAITSGNVAYCWGSNLNGQLGDASFVDRTTPVAVSGAYQSVTTGRQHSCALTPGSVVACWGLNDDGQLGDGTFATHNTPFSISGTYQSVTAGGFHTCALSTSTVYCWGDNFDGQLGNGGNTTSGVPVAVAGSYSAVTAGMNHTCAVRTTGGVIDCWGLNSDGQLGNGGTTNRNTPGPISSTLAFQSVTGGSRHTCALTTAGAVYCWGSNGSGQLGDNSTTDRLAPVQVSGGLTFQSLNAGDFHTCGITSTNVLYCWGEGFTGQLGNGSFSDRKTPTLVGGLVAFQAVEAGGSQTCGYGTSGRGYCWGNNERGQLGNGTLTIQTSPAIVVTGPAAVPALATAGYSAQEDLARSPRSRARPTQSPGKPSSAHGPAGRERQR